MIEVQINQNIYKVNYNLTIISLCNNIHIDIPRFCYHELLTIAGNCRMCLVEVEKSLKPVASCAMPINSGMKIFTESLIVKKARENVMELLLINHPLDCPICDQGGECDLQDQAVIFGSDRGRFYEYKRAVENKNCGPLIKTVMTRCIHCTRCIRFFNEIAGIKNFGVTGRGNTMEIGTYVDNENLSTEISGNVIDLCPVGALISKTYAFTVRSWELKIIETIDVFDNLGSNILICLKGNNIMRILPHKNFLINEVWISDKVRFNYDGLIIQRLVRPLFKYNHNFINISWEKIFSKILRKIFNNKKKLQILLGFDVELESAFLCKEFINGFGSDNISSRKYIVNSNIDFSNKYKLNTSIKNFELIDFCIIIGVNIRFEFPLLSIRLRKIQNKKKLIIIVIGNNYDFNLDVNIIGNGSLNFLKFLEGRLNFCSLFLYSNKPLLLIGDCIINNLSCNDIFGNIYTLLKHTNILTKFWNGINFSSIGSTDIGFLELGINIYKKNRDFNLLYLINSDELELKKKKSYVIYQGHHGDSMVNDANIILPSVNFIEKEGLYANIEGRIQKGRFVMVPKGDMRIDWKIINSLKEFMYYDIFNIYNKITDIHKSIIEIYPCVINLINYGNLNINRIGFLQFKNTVYNNVIHNYYFMDNISRASKVINLCNKKNYKNKQNFNLYYKLSNIKNIKIKNKVWF